MRTLLMATLIGVSANQAATQRTTVLPSSAASTDAGSLLIIAGFNGPSCQQILVGASQLTGLIGQSITGISFRRDYGWDKRLRGGATTLTVTLSPTSVAPGLVSPVFAANSNPVGRTIVFQGTVALPASTEASQRSASWSDPQDVVSITFATSYAYTGGHLCIELVGTPVTGNRSPYWPVDAALDTARGVSTEIGQPCGIAGTKNFPTTVADYTLIAGNTPRFLGWGARNVGGALFIGTPIPAIDLSSLGLGGPGCELHVAPFATTPVYFAALSATSQLGAARFSLQIPFDNGSLSLPFRAQFVALTNPIETTNAIDCVVAGDLPTLAMSCVFAPFDHGSLPAEGVVRTNRVPVIRLHSQ